MDFNTALAKLQEAAILPMATLKSKSASAEIDAALERKNAELKKKGKQVKIDPKTGRAEVVRVDKNTSNAISMIDKLQ